MQKINFSKEHHDQLKSMLTAMLFNNEVIKGMAGTEINAYQLLHQTTTKTLQNLYVNVIKEIETNSKLDRWSMTDYQQSKLDSLKRTGDLLDLLIGYKKWLAQSEANASKLKDLRNTLAEMKDQKKTPEEKMAEIEKQISELEA